ncbi:MAG: hypothetical protein Q4B26_02855 [Eubacteriales bacterium]|nr:hypothetical protein [Eubacteriales bacterium]
MTQKDLKKFFKDHMVPSKLYKIGGHHNHRICIEQTKDGWDVFFSEKKEKVGVLHYQDEESACTRMKEEIRKIMESMYGLTWAQEI